MDALEAERRQRRRLKMWTTAAMLKDRSRRAIRARARAGESMQSIAQDYDIPTRFVRHMMQAQLFEDRIRGQR